MIQFDMSSEGIIRNLEGFKDRGAPATRLDQAFLVLSIISSLCKASKLRMDSHDEYDNSAVSIHQIRSMMRGTCSVLDDDFAEILSTVADISSHSDLYAAVMGQHIKPIDDQGKVKQTKTYFIKNRETGLLKIGRSRDPESRAKALQCGAGAGLDIILIINEDVEQELHSRFSNDRAFGEWFHHSSAIEEYIRVKREES